MRVIALLLLSCVCGVLAQTPTQTWQVTGNSGTNAWIIDGNNNPSINVTEGNLYAFNITYLNNFHPFNFSSDSNTASVVLSAIDPAFIITTTGTCTSTMSATTNLFGYVATAAPTTPCTIWLNVTSGAANKTIYYRCAQHQAMVGSITAWAAAAATNTTTAPPTATPTPTPTTAANTTNAPTNSTPTATPTPTASPAPATPAPAGTVITGTTFRIIQGSPVQGWLFADSNNNQFWNPTIQPTPGTNLTFSLEYTGLHPFGLSNTSATGVANTQTYFPDVLDQFITIENINGTACDQTYAGTTNTYNPTQPTSGPVIKCVIKVTVPTGMTGTAFYRCAIHDKMIGQIILGTSSTPTPTATPTPTPTSNTTNAPTTKPNSASTISALVAIVMAMIATLFN